MTVAACERHYNTVSRAFQGHFILVTQLFLRVLYNMYRLLIDNTCELPHCPTCKQVAIVIAEELNHRVLDYPCGHAAEERAKRIAEENEQNAAIKMVDAGIATMYSGATFDTFVPSAGTRKAFDAAIGIVAMIVNKSTNGLVLYSQGNGCGKTHLARAILKAVIHTGSSGLWARHCEMNHEAHRMYRHCRLLVVDDMWKRSTKTSAELLYDVLDARIARGLPTVVTTNVTQKQAENSLGLEHAHVISGVYSRLSSLQIVELSGPDYRPQATRYSQ
jgi:chromosomal replication initiation ATPase DnaA